MKCIFCDISGLCRPLGLERAETLQRSVGYSPNMIES
jgi:hypothetical protein